MGESANVRTSVVLPLLMLFLMQEAEAIWLTLPPTGLKCVSEEIHGDVVVLADYYVVSDDPINSFPSVSVKVTSPYSNVLHHRENATHGQFAFTTKEAGQYLACFSPDGNTNTGGLSVNVDWRTGIAAKDWDLVAKKEKIEGVELELKKLFGAVEAVHENLLYLKSREAEMRIVSENTNAKVAYLGIMSLGACIVVSAIQLWHLKRFFQKKKLI